MCLRVVHSCSLQITPFHFLMDEELHKFSSLGVKMQALFQFNVAEVWLYLLWYLLLLFFFLALANVNIFL